jgi:hypothetical protein
MKRLIPVVAILALLTALVGCWRKTADWHQKLTLVIETPQGEVTGSSVIAISFTGANKIILADLDTPILRMHGEAAMVEVLPGKYLFALMGDQDHLIYNRVKEPSKGLEAAIPAILAQREPLTLYPITSSFADPAFSFPMLVTFDDISDPTTVKLVDPNDLASSFGAGVYLKSVTVQVTDEPVTEGRVEGVLGWLEAVGRERASLMGKPKTGLVSDQPNPTLYLIAPSDFSTELYK